MWKKKSLLSPSRGYIRPNCQITKLWLSVEDRWSESIKLQWGSQGNKWQQKNENTAHRVKLPTINLAEDYSENATVMYTYLWDFGRNNLRKSIE